MGPNVGRSCWSRRARILCAMSRTDRCVCRRSTGDCTSRRTSATRTGDMHGLRFSTFFCPATFKNCSKFTNCRQLTLFRYALPIVSVIAQALPNTFQTNRMCFIDGLPNCCCHAAPARLIVHAACQIVDDRASSCRLRNSHFVCVCVHRQRTLYFFTQGDWLREFCTKR